MATLAEVRAAAVTAIASGTGVAEATGDPFRNEAKLASGASAFKLRTEHQQMLTRDSNLFYEVAKMTVEIASNWLATSKQTELTDTQSPFLKVIGAPAFWTGIAGVVEIIDEGEDATEITESIDEDESGHVVRQTFSIIISLEP